MRSFLVRCAVFLAIAAIPTWLLLQLSMRYPPSYSEAVAIGEVQRTIRERTRIEALSLGNSHARAIEFSHLALDGVTVGLPWNDLAEVEFQVQTLAPRLPRLEVVLIALSYFSFHWSNVHGDEERLLTGRRQFYAAVPPRRWMKGDLDNFIIGNSYWIARPDNWYFAFAPLLGRDFIESQRRRYYFDRAEAKTPEHLRRHAELRVPRKLELIPYIRERHPGVVHENYERLGEIVRYLRARGVRVVLFTPPYYQDYTALYSSEPTLAEFRMLAARFQAEHQVEYYDFSADPLAGDHLNYRDSDHLNDRGTARFAKILGVTLGIPAAAHGRAPTGSSARLP